MLKVLCSDLIPSSGEIVQILPTIRKAVQNLLDSSPRVSANNGGTCYACYFTSFKKLYISDELINGRLLSVIGRLDNNFITACYKGFIRKIFYLDN